MYNAENSKPRKGFGQTNTHKCPHCNKEYHFPNKLPFMIECSGCKNPVFGDELVQIKKRKNE